jgi:hypothetical protein
VTWRLLILGPNPHHYPKPKPKAITVPGLCPCGDWWRLCRRHASIHLPVPCRRAPRSRPNRALTVCQGHVGGFPANVRLSVCPSDHAMQEGAAFSADIRDRYFECCSGDKAEAARRLQATAVRWTGSLGRTMGGWTDLWPRLQPSCQRCLPPPHPHPRGAPWTIISVVDRMDVRTYGRADRQTGRQMDRQADGLTDSAIGNPLLGKECKDHVCLLVCSSGPCGHVTGQCQDLRQAGHL